MREKERERAGRSPRVKERGDRERERAGMREKERESR